MDGDEKKFIGRFVGHGPFRECVCTIEAEDKENALRLFKHAFGEWADYVAPYTSQAMQVSATNELGELHLDWDGELTFDPIF